MKNETDSNTLKDQIEHLKRVRHEFNAIVNSIRGKISFRVIRSWPQLFEHLPLDVANIASDSKLTKGELNLINYNSLVKEVIDRLNLLIANPPGPIEIIPKDSRHTKDEKEDDIIEHPPINKEKQKAKLYKFQLKAASKLYSMFTNPLDPIRGGLLIASTGHGKTFIYGQISRWLYDKPETDPSLKTMGPFGMMIVTKSTVIVQTQRVLRNYFGLSDLDCCVMSYDGLRSNAGKELFIKEKVTVIDGNPHVSYLWNKPLAPAFIIFDEVQAAKNVNSIQSRITQAASGLIYTKVLGVSATPFTRVSEAKAIVLNMHVPYGE